MAKSDEITKKKKWLLPVLLGAVALVLVAAGIGGFVYIKSVALPKKELQKKLDLADKYLTDMDYENAIFAYKQAISINPKSEEAYLGLGRTTLEYADLLIEEGDVDEAVNVLKDGIKALKNGAVNAESERIRETLDELKEKKKELERTKEPKDVSVETAASEVPVSEPVFQSVDINSVPEGLQDFIAYTEYLGFYDCEKTIDESYTMQGLVSGRTHAGTFADAILDPYMACDFTLYRDFINVPAPGEVDTTPGFAVGEPYWSYYLYDEAGMDWIFKNIYNVNDTNLEILKRNYLVDGKYQGEPLGVGGPEKYYKIKRIESDGRFYRVEFETGMVDFAGEEHTYYVLVEYKIINGNGYWSLYKYTDQSLF